MQYSCMLLAQTGGVPSGRRGSTFTAIHTALGAYKLVVQQSKVFYLPLLARTKLAGLKTSVLAFEQSLHRHAFTANARIIKQKQRTAVASLRIELDTELKIARISAALDPPYGPSHSKLIQNSMEGWKQAFIQKTVKVEFLSHGNTLAQVLGGQQLQIDIQNCEQNFPQVAAQQNLRAFLVHEYHHLLSQRDGEEAYYDEFVAHWKQLDVQGKYPDKQDRLKRLNEWLLDNPDGYQYRHLLTEKYPIITEGPEQAGRFWHDFIDNEKS